MVRHLPVVLSQHLNYQSIPHATLSDLPSLLLGHYTTTLEEALPFNCTYDLTTQTIQPKSTSTRYTPHNCLTRVASTTPAPDVPDGQLHEEEEPPERPPRRRADQVPEPLPAEAPGPRTPPGNPDVNGEPTTAGTPLAASKPPDIHVDRYAINTLESFNENLPSFSECQINTLLASSSDESIPILFPRPPPDAIIEAAVSNKIIKRRRKANSRPLKRLRIVVNEPLNLPSLFQYNSEARIREIHTLVKLDFEYDGRDIITLLSAVENPIGVAAGVILVNKQLGLQISAEEQTFFLKARGNLLFIKMKERLATRHLLSCSLMSSSTTMEELEYYSAQNVTLPFCLDCRSHHSTTRSCLNVLEGGPNFLTLSSNSIDPSEYLAFDVIIFAFSAPLRNIEPGQLGHVLNLSPNHYVHMDGDLTGSLSEDADMEPISMTNTLFHDLLMIIHRLGPECRLPILVECRPPPVILFNLLELKSFCEQFVRNLALLQNYYPGLMVIIAPIPTWVPGIDLAQYCSIKSSVMRASTYLVGFGIVAGVYVVHLDCTSSPIGTIHKQHMTRRRFRRAPLFDSQGVFTKELRSRIMRDLDEELALIRAYSNIQF
jgi:hypothetical protein